MDGLSPPKGLLLDPICHRAGQQFAADVTWRLGAVKR